MPGPGFAHFNKWETGGLMENSNIRRFAVFLLITTAFECLPLLACANHPKQNTAASSSSAGAATYTSQSTALAEPSASKQKILKKIQPQKPLAFDDNFFQSATTGQTNGSFDASSSNDDWSSAIGQ
jgi:hypothetical protein